MNERTCSSSERSAPTLPAGGARVPAAPGRSPLLGHAPQLWRGPVVFLESLRQAGEITRVDIGRWPLYMLNGAHLVRQVLVDDARHFGRGRVFQRLRPLFGNGLVISDGDFHREQRRVMQPVFHPDRIPDYARFIAGQAGAMSASWRHGRAVRLDDETRRLTLSAVTALVFSGSLTETAVAEVHRSLPVILDGMLTRAVTPKALDAFPLPFNRRFDAASARLRDVVKTAVAQCRATGERREDLLSALLASRNPHTGEPMTDEQVGDEVIATIFAGTETSGTVLAWAFHEIGRHRHVEERLHAEVDEVVGRRPVRPEDLPHLTYTTAVCTEALRLHSPLLFTRRSLVPVELGGFTLPAGAEIAYSPYAMHRDPTLFERPAAFDPDRWITPATAPRRHTGFVPFGAGRHQCIGDTFATAEIVIALATVTSSWRLLPAPGHTVREVPAGIPRPDALPMIPAARHRPGDQRPSGQTQNRGPHDPDVTASW